MEELSDKDFDQIFKNRIKEGYLEYEEESWLKMEKKLRKRDQFVFFRNASIILLFLSFGIGLYLISSEKLITKEVKIAKSVEKAKESKIKKSDDFEKNNEILTEIDPKIQFTTLKSKKRDPLASKNYAFAIKPEIASTLSNANQNTVIDNSTSITQNSVVLQDPEANLAQESTAPDPIKVLVNEKANIPRKTKRPIALSINVGPDFNSTENAIGGKSGIAVGIGVSVPLSRKLSMQTGANYGSKNYEAQGYDYTFNNPNTVNTIAGIDASCKVLEIPLRASYTLMDNQKNSIDLNAGLSSYIMLKENYRFIYTSASGRKDRFLEEKNANQHYLSVIDLSATYNVKLKNKKFALGVQPYVKIPISGIGEGSVPLKSSGISLKLNYELNKKK